MTTNIRRLSDRSAGIPAQDLRDYNVLRALRALAGDMTKDEQRNAAGLEFEASDAIAKRLGEPVRSGWIHVPLDGLMQRDMTVAGSGGYLVGTEVAPGDVFMGTLRAASVTSAMGVQVVGDLVGNAAFPKRTSGTTAAWLSSESAQASETTPVFGQVAASPKSIAAYTEVSRLLMQQTSLAAQRFLFAELGADVGAALDAAIIQGSGSSGQPTGLLNTVGVTIESGTSLTWAKVAEVIGNVETANGVRDGARTGWAIAPDAAQILRAREKATGLGFIFADGKVDGRPGLPSTSVPAGGAVFGDWSQIVVASWGGLQIGIDPTANFKAGISGLRAIWTCDVCVLQPASFSAVTSIT